jgi:hypothetical protein
MGPACVTLHLPPPEIRILVPSRFFFSNSSVGTPHVPPATPQSSPPPRPNDNDAVRPIVLGHSLFWLSFEAAARRNRSWMAAHSGPSGGRSIMMR